MSRMRIIEMTEKEVPKVAAIEAEVFSCPWSEKSFFDTLRMDNVRFFLAVEDDEVLGYCGMYMAADEGEITNVAVKPEYRRRHIAGAILRAMLLFGENSGISRFYLEVRVSNYAAIHLYEKFGFFCQGIRKGFYSEPREDAYVMCRFLSDGFEKIT